MTKITTTLLLLFSICISAQNNATINVTVTDEKESPRSEEIIVFEDIETGQQHKSVSKTDGTFTTELPTGHSFLIKIIGFGEEEEYTRLDIPELKENQSGLTFDINIMFEPEKVFTLNNVHFATGSATITKDSYSELNELVEFLKLKPNTNIEIAGHTDDVGEASDNLKLSQRRAEAIKTFLTKKGISANRLTAVGYGEDQPIADNSSEEGRQLNRRTEVRILD